MTCDLCTQSSNDLIGVHTPTGFWDLCDECRATYDYQAIEEFFEDRAPQSAGSSNDSPQGRKSESTSEKS